MTKFNEEIKKYLFDYLKIENSDNSYIQECINYLEKYHYTSTNNWYEDNYYNDCNYGLLFGLCGLNGSRQQALQELMKDCFNIEMF